jgi:hypothetical protein
MLNLKTAQQEVTNLKQNGQHIVRHRCLGDLYAVTGHDIVSYFSAYGMCDRLPPDSAAGLAIVPNDIRGFMACLHGLNNEKLDLIIHSPGGSLEAAEQIVNYLRAKYKYIRAIIPQNAMSAATMIACACDEIIMGKHSAIGPIDPQINLGGVSFPAHTILADFKNTIDQIKADSRLVFLLNRFQDIPIGFIDFCEQTIKLAKEKVALWLKKYMFNGQENSMAIDIAEWLGNFEEHKTHGRPIGFDLANVKGLKVKRLEDDQKLQDAVLSVFHATIVTCQTTPCIKIIENHNGKGGSLFFETTIHN